MPISIDRLRDIETQLREGNSPPPVTVRELLSWFGSQRRGLVVVDWIRANLTAAHLTTQPDFQYAYIDSTIAFSLLPEDGQPETPAVNEEADSAVSSASEAEPSMPTAYADPTYRISKLAAANRVPTSVSQDTAITQAVTLMLLNDFSQLPVMTTERDVKGMISWTSIGTRLALGTNGTNVGDLMDHHQEIDADASLFQAIPIIVQHHYVLVRGLDKRIVGIVTASDLSLQFLQLAEPFLLLGEIENHIRRILASKFTNAELSEARDPNDTAREVNGVADLTFGEYIRLLENEHHWARLNLAIQRNTVIEQLNLVRSIRNDVMHFDPDPMPDDELRCLRGLVAFFQRLQQIGVT